MSQDSLPFTDYNIKQKHEFEGLVDITDGLIHKDKIINKLERNAPYVIRCLFYMWSLQTTDEQQNRTAAYKNSAGFNAFDAQTAGVLIDIYNEHMGLLPYEVGIARKLLKKYYRQLRLDL